MKFKMGLSSPEIGDLLLTTAAQSLSISVLRGSFDSPDRGRTSGPVSASLFRRVAGWGCRVRGTSVACDVKLEVPRVLPEGPTPAISCPPSRLQDLPVFTSTESRHQSWKAIITTNCAHSPTALVPSSQRMPWTSHRLRHRGRIRRVLDSSDFWVPPRARPQI
jgi:hypothetical protein